MYQPVFSIKTGWIVGKIESYVAKPLMEEEVREVCDKLNDPELPDLPVGFKTASDLLTAFKEDLGSYAKVEVNGTVYFSEPDVLTMLRIMQTKSAGKNGD
jgi:hypothetical protein